MGGELRFILATMGEETVTIASFAALLLYGLVLFAMTNGSIGRFAAILVFGSSATWLVLVALGPIHDGRAGWSPVAVILLAIGMEGYAMSHAMRRLDKSEPSAPADLSDLGVSSGAHGNEMSGS